MRVPEMHLVQRKPEDCQPEDGMHVVLRRAARAAGPFDEVDEGTSAALHPVENEERHPRFLSKTSVSDEERSQYIQTL